VAQSNESRQAFGIHKFQPAVVALVFCVVAALCATAVASAQPARPVVTVEAATTGTTAPVARPASEPPGINTAEAAARAIEAANERTFKMSFVLHKLAEQQAANRIPYDYGLWVRVHICEQGNTWHAGGHFGNGLLAGGNGLGFSAEAWREAVGDAKQRGVDIPASGFDASITQQMQAAQAFMEANHGGGPDCLKRVRH